jgi:allantoin racemase
MRIKIINPNTTKAMTDSIYNAAVMCARPDTEIVAVNPKDGPVSIENFHDQYTSVFGLMEEMHKGVQENFDAFIVAAACDPGLYAAREIADAPVIGIGEASMYMASLVASKFSVVTVRPRIVPLIEKAVQQSGLSDKCISIRSINVSVLDTENNPGLTEQELLSESKKAIECDGAEAICLGCSGMVKFAQELEDKLGVPVFDGVVAAVKLAEALVDMRKKTSKLYTFKYPEKKEYKGIAEKLTP